MQAQIRARKGLLAAQMPCQAQGIAGTAIKSVLASRIMAASRLHTTVPSLHSLGERSSCETIPLDTGH